MSLALWSLPNDAELAPDALELAVVVPTFNELENIDTWCSPLRPPWKVTIMRSSLLTITALMERLTEFVKLPSAISGSVASIGSGVVG